jgi:hypothetical protein
MMIARKAGNAPLRKRCKICYRMQMPDKDPVIRKTVSLPASAWSQVEDFQFSNRIKRETEAIRRLIELGLEAAKAEKGKSF